MSTDSEFDNVVNNTDMTTVTMNPARYKGDEQAAQLACFCGIRVGKKVTWMYGIFLWCLKGLSGIHESVASTTKEEEEEKRIDISTKVNFVVIVRTNTTY